MDKKQLVAKLEPLYLDYSHVTKKLLQAINYVIYGIYEKEDNYYELIELDEVLFPLLQDFEKGKKYRHMKATLLPPPIFDTEMFLTHEEINDIIPFGRLSSGERQFAYTISNFLYHLVNIDSAWNDYYHDKDHSDVVKYHYVNVIFDEVELYFHPDMQRQFISYLMSSLRSVRFSPKLRGVNIMLATHSPFILSDIPSSSVLALGERNYIGETFGANINEMLGNTFFIESTIGEIVRQELSKIVGMYRKAKSGENVKAAYEQNKRRMHYVVDNLADKYLKTMAASMIEYLNRTLRR